MRIARFICSFLLAVGLLAVPAQSRAQVVVGSSVRIGAPVLQIYAQPICPGRSYIWVPGYWAYGPDGYFWVPGTWVFPPEVGLLWTPGYWGWEDGFYAWYPGYWGPKSASMAALTTVSAIPVSAISAATGEATRSTTTAPSPT